MNEEIEKSEKLKQNKLVGPGLGLIIMGTAYLIWWLLFIEYAILDPRWTHNIAYAIIILNIGLAWYHKSPFSRFMAMIQSFMLPITASGSFNTVICTWISLLILIFWIISVFYEKTKGKMIFEDKLSKRGKNWLNMHAIILAWLLIGHMGLMFFIVRLPLEAQLYSFSEYAGYLMNLPPESYEFATWAFDIGLFLLIIIILWEQYKMGYNFQNNPWPSYSFWIVLITMGIALLALLIQSLTIGMDWVDIVYG
ncbi:MAG: hypothetical protein GF317_20895 [Candidatus Lokiarchaeota archaeon]|nr:hypothetical protein [Candidatus Lokiarchaeota archaeon]MBD3201903.1 hypothetical protein [Candidatus Lokiarchaeota archaeon]